MCIYLYVSTSTYILFHNCSHDPTLLILIQYHIKLTKLLIPIVRINSLNSQISQLVQSLIIPILNPININSTQCPIACNRT